MYENFELAGIIFSLPPMIARKKVAEYFGGAVSSKTLANADSNGTGPKNRFKIGREVVYPTQSLVEWLDGRIKILSA